jgi:hypothetical protein
MPFTFSHPAVVLPFSYLGKRYVSLAGLIAGSMVPDFDYFINMKHGNNFKSHTWPGLFWFDLPLGLLLLLVYYGIVFKPLINNLPAILKSRVGQYQGFDWVEWMKKKWPVIILSVLIGSVSHLLWDKLTHESVQYIDEALTIKDKNELVSYRNPYYFLSWNLNSLAGMLFILFSFWRLPADKTISANKGILNYWLTAAGITALVFVIRIVKEQYLGKSDVVVTAMSAFMLALIFTSLIFRNRTSSRLIAG